MGSRTKSFGFLLALVFLVSLVTISAHSPLTPLVEGNSAWSTQTIAAGGSFGPIYMALDSNNSPHVVFSGANGLLYYASWDESKWNVQAVIQGGTPTGLELDSHNNPHILYKGSNGVTYYASWHGLNWSFRTVPAGSRYSLALDSAGNPHLAYATDLPVSEYPKGVTNDISILNYASWNDSNWSIQTVDSPISDSDGIYLALNHQNNPCIMYGYDTYYSPTVFSLIAIKLATWNGSSWNIQTALSNIDYFGNMVLDSDNFPHFIYEIGSALDYASWDGSTWNTQTVVSSAALGSFDGANLALDSDNQAHIEFFNGALLYAGWTGASWNIQTVAPNNFAYGEGPLALESNGNPLICYWVDDIHDTTAFVSQLIITSPTNLAATQSLQPLPATLNSLPPLQYSATKLWDFAPASSEIISPVVADGRVYFLTGNSGALPAALYCLDGSTGAEIWNQTGIFNVFTVVNGYVYLGEGLPGAVVCLNAYTGAQLWSYSNGTDVGSLAAAGGVVYAGGQRYMLSTDAGNGFIYAFNALTGTLIWNYTGSDQTRFDQGNLVIAEGTLYAVSAFLSDTDSSWHGDVVALDASTGKELWNYGARSNFNSLVAGSQYVYVSSSFADTTNYVNSENVNGRIYEGGILALNAADGTEAWNYPTSSSVASVAILGSLVYAVSADGTIYAFNAENGVEAWNYDAGTGLGSLLSANDYLYVGSSSGVYCFNATDGNVVWNFAASDLADSSTINPTFSEGIIYLGWNGPMFFAPSTQHNFYAVDAWNGQELWNYTLEYTIYSPPVVANGTVYIGGNFVTTRNPDYESSGSIYALKPNVSSEPFTKPSLAPTSTQGSSPSKTHILNPVLLATLTAIAICIAVTFILLMKRGKNKLKPLDVV